MIYELGSIFRRSTYSPIFTLSLPFTVCLLPPSIDVPPSSSLASHSFLFPFPSSSLSSSFFLPHRPYIVHIPPQSYHRNRIGLHKLNRRCRCLLIPIQIFTIHHSRFQMHHTKPHHTNSINISTYQRSTASPLDLAFAVALAHLRVPIPESRIPNPESHSVPLS
ncbi:hypothetical protein PTI98_000478 [Pleurotus ostreatus]|nr:hypothetical protein PTI98_000478 [Pleurotus ostreatus]